MEAGQLRERVRLLLVLFVVGLVVSGLTAVPLMWEIDILQHMLGDGTVVGQAWPPVARWVSLVHRALTETSQKYPFMFYGTDWLAFAHIAIAVAFWGPMQDPVKNVWVVEFGMIACLLVIPTAMICGPMRGIPFLWRLLDCSFGVFGIIPLWLARRYIQQIVALEQGMAKAEVVLSSGGGVA